MNQTEQNEVDLDPRDQELLDKFIVGELTLEEANEFIGTILVRGRECMDIIHEQEEQSIHLAEGVNLLGRAAEIYQDFIDKNGLNEKFHDFYESALKELEEENEQQEEEPNKQ